MSVSKVQQVTQDAATVGADLGFVFGGAPTNTNLMAAIITHFTNGPTWKNGWTQLFTQNAGDYDISAGYKYAGAGESATQAPIAGGIGALKFAAWELVGVTGTIGTDVPVTSHHAVDIALTTTFSTTSFNSSANNQGIIGILSATKASTTPTSASLSGGTANLTLDSTLIGNSGPQRRPIIKAFHDYFATSGTAVQYTMSSITPNLAFGQYSLLQIANWAAPGGPGVTDADRAYPRGVVRGSRRGVAGRSFSGWRAPVESRPGLFRSLPIRGIVQDIRRAA